MKHKKTGDRPPSNEQREPQSAPVEDDRTPERKAVEARAAMAPAMRHSMVSTAFAQSTTGFGPLSFIDGIDVFGDECRATRKGDLTLASNLLTSQALTLDTIFTDMMSRACQNLGKYPDAVERYMRYALKAQAQSRATIEALTKMHQPRVQTVRHVHIDNRGGQAVVAETVTTGGRNNEYADQSYGPNFAGSIGPALLGEDPEGNGVPVPCDEGKEAVPDSRREGGGTQG